MPGQDHFYGGQAVLEGVMMRGRDHWAVAVRRPDQSVHVESHVIRSIARRFPVLGKPGLRGVLALGQALSIGARAITVSANQSVEDDKRLTPRQMAFSMVLAFVVFTGLYVIAPYIGFSLFRRDVPSGLVRNLAEGVVRVLLFLGYLLLIGRMKEIRRVFQYHGAEHKTITAYEHGDRLDPETVDRWPTLHVRCGTNFLIIVMLLTVLVYTAFGWHGILAGILFRVVAIPVIAGISYELLRLGAKFPGSPVLRALMKPGLWLQKITTRPPDRGQIEVAISAFEALKRTEAGRAASTAVDG
ncbi:MAG: DUF1385 domain-containing protein [Actinobacteria bacterium]|nr:MAG: DUF1385 domain-containing protein [Actinomycetota bacterium]